MVCSIDCASVRPAALHRDGRTFAPPAGGMQFCNFLLLFLLLLLFYIYYLFIILFLYFSLSLSFLRILNRHSFK